jgi:hypothetical protein
MNVPAPSSVLIAATRKRNSEQVSKAAPTVADEAASTAEERSWTAVNGSSRETAPLVAAFTASASTPNPKPAMSQLWARENSLAPGAQHRALPWFSGWQQSSPQTDLE